MSSNGDNPSYLYLGLAGETGRGRVVHSGLLRLADGSDEWEPLQRGLPEMPAVRALAVHPLNSSRSPEGRARSPGQQQPLCRVALAGGRPAPTSPGEIAACTRA